MPTLNPFDQLQPVLLDRLTDRSPHTMNEAQPSRQALRQQLRLSLLRDLRLLFNSKPLLADDANPLPEACAASVLNFGLNHHAGQSLSSQDPEDIASEIATTIRRFEPRLNPQCLQVRPLPIADGQPGWVLPFLIEAELWHQTAPEALYLRAELDVQQGLMHLEESRGS